MFDFRFVIPYYALIIVGVVAMVRSTRGACLQWSWAFLKKWGIITVPLQVVAVLLFARITALNTWWSWTLVGLFFVGAAFSAGINIYLAEFADKGERDELTKKFEEMSLQRSF